ncbi:hypothetical protein J7K50_05715 [bacterium]|nr:hypothetical protein [bacterium]
MEKGKRHFAGRMTFGVLIICAGITLLLNTVGYLDWCVWDTLWRFWPVLLITAGINVIFERTALWPVVFISPLIIAGIFWFVIIGYEASGDSGNFILGNASLARKQIESEFIISGYEDEEIELVHLEINGTAGEIEIEPGANESAGDIVYITSLTRGYVPKVEDKIEGNILNVIIPEEKYAGVFGRGGHEYSIELSTDYPYNIEINTGAGNISLDLAELEVEGIEINSGAASVMLVAPSRCESGCSIELNSGASEIKIGVPKGVSVGVDSTGLGSIEVGELEKSDGRYVNPDEEGEAGFKVDIEVNSAIGSINLYAYDEEDTSDISESEENGDVDNDAQDDEVENAQDDENAETENDSA